MAEQAAALTASVLESDTIIDECAHHWLIASPNGETSEAECKHCGKTRNFLNYSQRRTMVRSVKPNAVIKISV